MWEQLAIEQQSQVLGAFNIMAKGDKTVIFLKDYAGHKKGSVFTFSRDLSYDLIREKIVELNTEKQAKKK